MQKGFSKIILGIASFIFLSSAFAVRGPSVYDPSQCVDISQLQDTHIKTHFPGTCFNIPEGVKFNCKVKSTYKHCLRHYSIVYLHDDVSAYEIDPQLMFMGYGNMMPGEAKTHEIINQSSGSRSGVAYVSTLLCPRDVADTGDLRISCYPEGSEPSADVGGAHKKSDGKALYFGGNPNAKVNPDEYIK